MKLNCAMLVVTNIEKSVNFYREILGLRVTMDLGANVTLTGGLALQTKESYQEFIELKEGQISFGGLDAEIYFEEEEFDSFLDRLKSKENIQYVHEVKEHEWGQRVIRIMDPDRHIIEVGENMKIVCRRFLNGGMTAEETAGRMGVPLKYVNACIK